MKNSENRLVVYRGQGISPTDFQQILDNVSGFFSFNNFFITTTDRDLASLYARTARDYHELVGVVFQIEIDRSIPVFTPLNNISYYLFETWVFHCVYSCMVEMH